jgi:hypothetical protein
VSHNANWLTKRQLERLAFLTDSSEELLVVQTPAMALENVVLCHFPRLQLAMERDGRVRELTAIERRIVDKARDVSLEELDIDAAHGPVIA